MLAGSAHAEWEVLFDGRSTAAWRSADSAEFPASSWLVKDGLLTTIPDARFEQDLWTRNRYRDFELEFDWRARPGGNSGVKCLVQDWIQGHKTPGRAVLGKPHEKLSAPDFEVTAGFEYQIVDEASAEATDSPTHGVGALYEYLAPMRRAAKATGSFNRSRLVVRGEHVEHLLNGKKVLEYEITGAPLAGALAGSKRITARLLERRPERTTPIALQHHASEVSFRSLRIRRLAP